ncbi:MAG TPA: glycosyltransferase [Ohtaekwangia sp.]
MFPKVSVICLCYNHEDFVKEALESVWAQTYPNIELIIVDDASRDRSVEVIRKLLVDHPHDRFIALPENVGNCRAFNQAFSFVTGEYVIDFATDDVMEPDRISRQVALFNTLDNSFGVIFTDAIYIDVKGKVLREHFAYLQKKKLLAAIPTGDVYQSVLTTYFICSPTMMIRTKVLTELNGYDPNLSYEDFDFWVRSSRNYKYAYLPDKLTRVRRTGNSMSSGWYKRGDKQLYSTYRVCEKALLLNRTTEDNRALCKRVKYELRHSVFSGNRVEARLFYNMTKQLRCTSVEDHVLLVLNFFRLPLRFLRAWYYQLRYSD